MNIGIAAVTSLSPPFVFFLSVVYPVSRGYIRKGWKSDIVRDGRGVIPMDAEGMRPRSTCMLNKDRDLRNRLKM